MDILFCHGLESVPHGRKYQALTDAGLEVAAPDFRGMNLQERVAKLNPIVAAADAPLLVGSSYGGITALCSAMQYAAAGGVLTGLVLCAPALGRDEPPANEMVLRAPVRTIIVHGLRDDVIPIAVSRSLAAVDERVTLIEVDDDHRLDQSLAIIVDAVERFCR